MSEYAYSLNAIASHLRDLSKELSKLLDISHDDAWEMYIQKLNPDNKYLFQQPSQISKKFNLHEPRSSTYVLLYIYFNDLVYCN